jgi:hypothetical protein
MRAIQLPASLAAVTGSRTIGSGSAGDGPEQLSNDISAIDAATAATKRPVRRDYVLGPENEEGRCAPAGSRTHSVALEVEAQKLKGSAMGKEKPVPMNDAIEVAVFDADGKSLYRQPHRIRSGTQTITVTVKSPRKPASAAIDPDHALLDRKPDDNTAEVDAENAAE